MRKIGPVRVMGRWDGERLRGEAWWPKQSLTVFQPLVPPQWKMNLREGTLHVQVAFSAAAEQGFEAGGHGVLKGGSAWMPDNQVNGVDFVLPFRFSDGTWQLGIRHPVSLRIGKSSTSSRAQSDGGSSGFLALERRRAFTVEQRQRRYSWWQADHAATADAAARPGAVASAKHLQQRISERN
jgi:hypothetical protein